jgi:hypothetical protein
VPVGKLPEKDMKKINLFASLNSLKRGVGSGSFIQRYGSGDPDPDPHQNVTDPQHCFDNSVMQIFHQDGVPSSLKSSSMKVSRSFL